MHSNSIILCPTARLARSIQNDIAFKQQQAGQQQWHTANVQTLSQWLQGLIQTAQLTGALAADNAPLPLSAFNEQLLWQEVITQSLKKNAFGDLFDVTGLALAAMEANQYTSNNHNHLYDLTLKAGPRFSSKHLAIDIQGLGGVLGNNKGGTSVDAGGQVKLGITVNGFSNQLFVARTQSLSKFGISFGYSF